MHRKILLFTILISVSIFLACNKKEDSLQNDKRRESVSQEDKLGIENKEDANQENSNQDNANQDVEHGMSKEDDKSVEGEINEAEKSDTNRKKMSLNFSNMADDSSKEEVREALSKVIKQENVDKFMALVSDYNETIENTSLNNGFKKEPLPEYDLSKMIDLWSAKKGNFVGTNCRINTFMLLKDELKMGEVAYDDSLLFMDKDAILSGKLFDDKESENFKRLFSRVKTEATKDTEVHAKKMKEYFSKISFSKDAVMVSVVLHDNLDGDYLFIGHTGVSVPIKDGYLFVEKLAFEEPYQAIKFSTKTQLYDYLSEKYKDYQDEATAKPFIMENGEPVKH